MNTFLMWLGGLLICAFTALFAVPHFIDWNGYRGIFEEEASRVFGRDVRVGGSVNVRLLPTPYVRFEKLKIADTSGVTGAPLFQADSFTMWLSVPPLLKGVFEARKVQLDRPVVRLAIDRNGAPNWNNLSLQSGQLPFVPADVTLQSVMINDGEVAYDTAGAGTLARITGIDGDLSSRGWQGPFTFRGTAVSEGMRRDVRLGTGDISDDGTTRLQAVVQSLDGLTRHKLEGDVAGIFGRPTLKGQLQSRVRLTSERTGLELDVRSGVEATTDAAKLENLVLSFENAGPPQIVTGSVGAAWGARHRVRVDLASRWLDLDRLAQPLGASSKAAADGAAPADSAPVVVPGQTVEPDGPRQMPLAVARQLFAQLIQSIPASADLQAELAIDQVNLGGEAVSNIVLVLADEGGPLLMRSLSANLPGGTRVDFSGQLMPGAANSGAAFDGNVFVGGPSLVRVMKWATPGYDRLGDVADGAYALSGRLSLGTHRVSLRDATAEFSGVPVRGSVMWQDKPMIQLDIALDGYEIDTRWAGLDTLRLSELFDGTSRADSAPQLEDLAQDGTRSGDDLKLSLRAGRFVNGDDVLEDFDLSLSSGQGGVKIEKLAFKTPEGFALTLAGDATTSSDKIAGDMTFTISADGPDGASAVGRLLAAQGLSNDAERRRLQKVLRGFAPYRLAGRLDLGGRKPGAVDITLDGLVQGQRAVAKVALDEGLDAWQQAPLSAHVQMNADDALAAVRTVLGNAYPADASRFARRPSGLEKRSGRVVVHARGVPSRDLAWAGNVAATGFDVAWSASGSIKDDVLEVAQGTLDVRQAQAGDLMALAGVSIANGARQTPVSGQFDIAGRASRYVLDSGGLRVGPSRVSGRLELVKAQTDGVQGPVELGAIQVSGALKVDRVTVADLLSGVTREQVLIAPPPQVAIAPSGFGTVNDANAVLAGRAANPLFVDRPFDFQLSEGLTGQVGLSIGRLEFDRGLTLEAAKLDVGIDAETGIKVALKEATSPAGAMLGSVVLSPAERGTGARLSGTLSFPGADLASLMRRPDGAAFAEGRGAMTLSFEGRGLTSKALALAVKGKGQLTLNNAAVAGLSPAALGGIAKEVLDTRIEALATSRDPAASPEIGLAQKIQNAALSGRLLFPKLVKVPISIADGAVQFAKMRVPTANGGVSEGVTTVEIATLQVESDWRVMAGDIPPEEIVVPDDLAGVIAVPQRAVVSGAWPPVSVVFVGPLRALGQIPPRVNGGAFERELAVQKMERNVRRLERLRAEDEARAEQARVRQDELERLRVEEEARARELVRQRELERLERARAERARGAAADQGWAPAGEPVPWQ